MSVTFPESPLACCDDANTVHYVLESTASRQASRRLEICGSREKREEHSYVLLSSLAQEVHVLPFVLLYAVPFPHIYHRARCRERRVYSSSSWVLVDVSKPDLSGCCISIQQGIEPKFIFRLYLKCELCQRIMPIRFPGRTQTVCMHFPGPSLTKNHKPSTSKQ